MTVCKSTVGKWLPSHTSVLSRGSKGCRSNMSKGFWLLQLRMGANVMIDYQCVLWIEDKAEVAYVVH